MLNPAEFDEKVNDVVTLYSILDKKSGVYSPPFEARTESEAKRIVAMCVHSGSGSLISVYPTDFALYKISMFNKRTGVILSIPPLFVGDVNDVCLSNSGFTLGTTSDDDEDEEDDEEEKELSETVPSPATV